ncbi:MAG: PQQ-binding-like beta-propeller repeat protein [Fuerstiella sp.]|nr:PQQ-binding-like beta-propeller repeat protein [Fuerstiella sp.]
MLRLAILTLTICSVLASTSRSDWPQFRGPGGNGVADTSESLPADIGRDSSALVWRTPLPKGHSSPVIHGERIYVTGIIDKSLQIFALSRSDGSIIWTADADCEELESIHRIGSHATPSVATDGDVVVSLFGSTGLMCHDPEGHLLWHRQMGPFNNSFGAASSPLLVDNVVVMVQDHDADSFLGVYDKQSGKTVWRAERPNSRRNYATPCIWTVAGQQQIVVAGSAQVSGYDFKTGRVVWTIRGVSRVVNTTPVVGDDNRLYLACTGGSETEQPVFSEVLLTSDDNNNGTLEPGELPKSPIRNFFAQFDRDASGSLDIYEYNSIREIFSLSQTVAMAVRPGGKGDVTDSHIEWRQSQSIPRNSSPLYHDGTLFLVKDGGIASSLDARTGKILHRSRMAGTGNYYSSPVLGDGKLYVVSERGHVTVISTGPEWARIADGTFGEDVYASPAISHGCVFVRTVSQLYCFRQ